MNETCADLDAGLGCSGHSYVVEALAAAADFAQLLDSKANTAYIAGLSTQTVWRRVV